MTGMCCQQFSEESSDKETHLQQLAAQLDEERAEFESYRNNSQVPLTLLFQH